MISDFVTVLAEVRPEPDRLPLPRPNALLEVNQLSVVPPGHQQPTLRGVTFKVMPRQAVGVMGDNRTYENVVAVRAVQSLDGMSGKPGDYLYLV